MPGTQQQTFSNVTPVSQTFDNVMPIDQPQESPEQLRARVKAAMPGAPDLLVDAVVKNPNDPRYQKILAAVPRPSSDDTGYLSGVRSALPGLGDVAKSGVAALATGGLSLAYDTGKSLFDAARSAPQNYRTGIENIRAIQPQPTDTLGRVNSAVDQAIGGATSAVGPLVGVDPQSMAARAAKGDTAGILGEATVPAATAVAGAAANEGRAALNERAAWKPGGSNFIGPLPDSAENVQAHADLKSAIPATKSAPYTDAELNTAKPFLYDEHRTGPLKSVTDVRDAADAAIGKIEDHVADRIAQIPNDPIATNPKADVQKALSVNPRGQVFVDAGMKELQGLNLENPTISEADRIRGQLNAENRAVLKKNNYDIDTARKADPGFAAREAAAESLRNGIYDQLEDRGIEGVQGLRQAEGSVIKIRNAAQNQIFNGDKTVRSTAVTSPVRELAKTGLNMAGAGAGAYVGGPLGAAAGEQLAERAGKALTTGPLTRDALVERAFKNMDLEPVRYSTMNLQPVPAKEARPGTQWNMISDEIAPQGGLFDIHQSTPYENFTPQEKANVQAVRERPYQQTLDDPNATAAEKAEAQTELSRMRNTPVPQKLQTSTPRPVGPKNPGAEVLAKNADAVRAPLQAVIDDPNATLLEKAQAKFKLARLQGEPAANETPTAEEPQFVYRVRSRGEEGIPIGGSNSNAAHATTTLEDARRLVPGREAVTGEPQEIVRVDRSKLKQGKNYSLIPRGNQPAWVRFSTPVPESYLQVVE